MKKGLAFFLMGALFAAYAYLFSGIIVASVANLAIGLSCFFYGAAFAEFCRYEVKNSEY
jgi:hypothetical protein